MDFNIQDHLQRARDRFQKKDPEKEKIFEVLSQYYSSIEISNFDYSLGKIKLKSVHPTARIHIKKNKKKIIADCADCDVYLRDII